MPRIGLTSRIVHPREHDEPRDALAHDWPTFLGAELPDWLWTTLPNIGAAVVEHAKKWKLDGFVLTGGGDIGSEPLRDETEFALLKYALEVSLPVFGVCRGMQLVNAYFGGTTMPSSDATHRATRHQLEFFSGLFAESGTREVNSYHDLLVMKQTLAAEVEVAALADDGSIEALYVPGSRIAAICWHPEREHPAVQADVSLLQAFFTDPGGAK